ncbi:MAG: hypothetical protein M9918_22285 [Anaerolineae bacterium]|nr:hypothetical protein [Anaerolineae bacterium]
MGEHLWYSLTRTLTLFTKYWKIIVSIVIGILIGIFLSTYVIGKNWNNSDVQITATPTLELSATPILTPAPTATPTPEPTATPTPEPRVGIWQLIGDAPPVEVGLFYDVAICDNVVLAGTDNGVYRLINEKWVRVEDTPQTETWKILFVKDDCSLLYATTLHKGIWYLENGDWQPSDVELGSFRALLSIGSEILAGGDAGLFRSEIGGHSWEKVNSISLGVTGLTRNPDSSYVFASVWGDGIYVNENDSEEWVRVGEISNPEVYEAIGDTKGVPLIVGASVSSGSPDKPVYGLYRWDGTSSWVPTAQGYINSTFSVVQVGDTIFAGQKNAGMLKSCDFGLTWTPMNDGIPFEDGEFQVQGLRVDSTRNVLHAATSSGIWEMTLPDTNCQ